MKAMQTPTGARSLRTTDLIKIPTVNRNPTGMIQITRVTSAMNRLMMRVSCPLNTIWLKQRAWTSLSSDRSVIVMVLRRNSIKPLSTGIGSLLFHRNLLPKANQWSTPGRYCEHLNLNPLKHWQWISDSDDTVRFLYGFFAWRCDIRRGKNGRHCPGILCSWVFWYMARWRS